MKVGQRRLIGGPVFLHTVAIGMAAFGVLTNAAPVRASGRPRIIEVRPSTAQASATRLYSLEVKGTSTTTRASNGASITSTDTINSGSLDIWASFVRGGWRVSGKGELRVSTVETNTLCRNNPHRSGNVQAVAADGAHASKIKIFLSPGKLDTPQPYPCIIPNDTTIPVPSSTGAAAFIALVLATIEPFPLQGGVVRSTDTFDSPLALTRTDWDLTFTLIPYEIVTESLRPSAEPSTTHLRAAGSAGFYPVTPARIIDTRAAPSRVGPFGRLAAGQSIDVPLIGQATVPDGAIAAVINTTVTGPDGAGYLTMFPTGSARPLVSNLNFVAGQTVPNLVQVKIGVGGAVTIFNGGGATDVILDVVGYYGPGGAMYVPSVSDRSFDVTTNSAGPLIAFMVPDNVDGARVRGVARNVTIDAPSADGYLAVYPSARLSLNSNLNFRAGQTVANAVISGSSDDELDGQPAQAISYRVGPNVSSARLIVDTLGRFVDSDETGAGMFVPTEPCRALDTRPGTDRRGDLTGPVQAGRSVAIILAERCGLPDAAAIGSVVLNVTVVNPTNDGYVTLWTDGEAQPPTSTVNFAAGLVIPNHTIVYTSASGKISAGLSGGSTDLIIDVFGYYSA